MLPQASFKDQFYVYRFSLFASMIYEASQT